METLIQIHYFMNNITQKLNLAKAKILFHRLLCLLVLLMTTQMSWGQAQIIGQFPTMQGGLESQAVGAPSSTSTSALWGCKAGTVVYSIASTSPRTGSRYLICNSGAGTGKYIVSPSTTFAASTAYTIQFWYRTASATTTSTSYAGTISNDGSTYATASPNINFTTLLGNTWYKQTIAITSGSTTPTGAGNAFLKTNGTTSNTIVDFDDIVIYPGAVDTTIPAAASLASTAVVSTTSLKVDWTGDQYAGDTGGYVIVRSLSSSTVTLNANGIYAVGNASATGSGTIVAITGGIAGAAQSYTDTGLITGTPYYYSIFAVDKAFNYAAAATCN